ncbi:MAG: 5'-nucleotidase C-terminal domain-containing protein, partial [Propionibacteriaceae bacterium]|nr:5'-nucleotidase C-terminal domain-containing protein [Propionibacteriaceae bacterium]
MSKSLKRVMTALAAMALCVTGGVFIGLPAASAINLADVHIYTFNDFHGRLDAAVPLAYTLQKEVALAPDDSLVVAGGDLIGASAFASSSAQDLPTIQIMNTLAQTPNFTFQASAAGNHEFDQGVADIIGRVGTAQQGWTYLGANVVWKAGYNPANPYAGAALNTYSLVNLNNGVMVGVIGVVTEEVSSLVDPTGIANVMFLDPVATVNHWANYLKTTLGVDIVVAIYHDGPSTATSMSAAIKASATFKAIVNDTSDKVDAIINGHTHLVYNWTGDAAQDPEGLNLHPGRPVVQAGNNGTNIGAIDLVYDKDTKTVVSAAARPVTVVTPDATGLTLGTVADIKALVDQANAEAALKGNVVVGAITKDITTAFIGGAWVPGIFGLEYQTAGGSVRDDRANESTLGRLVADAYLGVAQITSVIGGADIGVINPGSLRDELYYAAPGFVTYAMANEVQPFLNNLWTIELTGAQFKQLLEQQWQTSETGVTPSRAFLALGLSSNVAYTVNTDVPTATACTMELGCAWDDPASHIKSVFINGEPLDPDRLYKIITVSFLVAGGDNFRVMPEGVNAKDTGLLDRDAWISYISNQSLLVSGTPTAAMAPNFGHTSVVVTNLTPATAPMAPTVVKAGGKVTATLSRLNLTSLGSPANATIDIYIGSKFGVYP